MDPSGRLPAVPRRRHPLKNMSRTAATARGSCATRGAFATQHARHAARMPGQRLRRESWRAGCWRWRCPRSRVRRVRGLRRQPATRWPSRCGLRRIPASQSTHACLHRRCVRRHPHACGYLVCRCQRQERRSLPPCVPLLARSTSADCVRACGFDAPAPSASVLRGSSRQGPACASPQCSSLTSRAGGSWLAGRCGGGSADPLLPRFPFVLCRCRLADAVLRWRVSLLQAGGWWR